MTQMFDITLRVNENDMIELLLDHAQALIALEPVRQQASNSERIATQPRKLNNRPRKNNRMLRVTTKMPTRTDGLTQLTQQAIVEAVNQNRLNTVASFPRAKLTEAIIPAMRKRGLATTGKYASITYAIRNGWLEEVA